RAQTLPPLHRFLAPVIGGALLGLLVLAARRSVRGHGTSGIIEAVAQRGGLLPIGPTLLRALATVVTVGSGGSLGREGPLVQVGAALGSLTGRRARIAGNRLKILVGCGAAAGIAAAYNAPIGGAMFALEVILGNFALESFGPIVVASVIGTLISRRLISAYPAYSPPPYTLVSSWELGHYLLMGLLIGAASALFIQALRAAESGFDRLPLKAWAKPILGFAVVGLIGVRFPQIFGNGYETTNQVLREGVPLELILLLPLLKVAATAATLGSGGAGGLFTPTLFIGSVLGSTYGAWCHEIFPAGTATPGAYALVGMGAMVAGTTQAPLTAILTIFELTGDYEIILPLMFACTVAVVVCRLLRVESIYTGALVARGVRLGGRLEELVMDTILVRDLMRQGAPPVEERAALDEVLKRLIQEGRKELFVVGGEGRFLGSITMAELSEHLGHPEALRRVRAGDVVYTDVPVLHLDDRLSEAIGRWSQVSRDRLPVVDGPVSRRYVGELSAGDIISLYSQEVLHKEARLARFERSGEGERPTTTYVELPREYVVALVMLPESFPGATLRGLDARRRFGVNVIEVKRRIGAGPERRIIPDPGMELKAGDALIVVGRPADIAHLSDPALLIEMARPVEGPAAGGPGAAGDEPA
ncbi:MAG TPA: chloride channel protein, partial [Candidatus Polarisedimenticolia bacterium]|nr:chloride channel protein [Candidatus Polarisedimenticolia bacterium]